MIELKLLEEIAARRVNFILSLHIEIFSCKKVYNIFISIHLKNSLMKIVYVYANLIIVPSFFYLSFYKLE